MVTQTEAMIGKTEKVAMLSNPTCLDIDICVSFHQLSEAVCIAT